MPLKSTLRKAAWTNRHCSTCDRYVITLIFSVDGIPSWSDKAERNGTECAGTLFYRRLFRGGTLSLSPPSTSPISPCLFYIGNISACALLALGLFISSAVSN